jgi:hypothetical protein
MHNVHEIKVQFVVKMYLYLKCSIKWAIQNTNLKFINQ